MDNLTIYNALKQPPKEALRTIEAGRLRGKTDINPQWRYKAMTEQFGICGVGWKYETTKLWTESAGDGQIFAFAMINLYIRREVDKTGEIEIWSDPIPGCGGSMLVEKEKAGLHANDEGYKMAITDALSTAMKMLGMAGDIYAGLWDGTKYQDAVKSTTIAVKSTVSPSGEKTQTGDITPAQTKKIYASAKEKELTPEGAKAYIKKTFNKESTKELTKSEASTMIEFLNQIKPGDSPLARAAKEMGGKEV